MDTDGRTRTVHVADQLRGTSLFSGIADGSARLCSGMRVRVDGSAGLITVLALDCEVVGA
ncbi:hypothetical protein ACTXG7_15075 [Mycolicibacterium sp. Dal123E01]|uniref:hypothetical protein n=1 Tax=Mycolicibacterium sp. Dal123E01 TaxID=3457578 RepID=UPI00403EBA9E